LSAVHASSSTLALWPAKKEWKSDQ
jgi:hypothetical protein